MLIRHQKLSGSDASVAGGHADSSPETFRAGRLCSREGMLIRHQKLSGPDASVAGGHADSSPETFRVGRLCGGLAWLSLKRLSEPTVPLYTSVSGF